jgi:hypothetical protein
MLPSRFWAWSHGTRAIRLLPLLMAGSCSTSFSFDVVSDPPGARVRMPSASAESDWRVTPAAFSVPYASGALVWEHSVGFFPIEVERGGRVFQGRLHAFDGGFKTGFTAVLQQVESSNGAAFYHRGNRVHAQLPIAGHFLVPYHFWGEPKCELDAKPLALDHKSGVLALAAGKHTIQSASWRAEIEAHAGFCIELFEWGSNDNWCSRFDYDPRQCSVATVQLDGHAPLTLSSLGWMPGFRANQTQFHLATATNECCDIAITFENPNPALSGSLSIRITHCEP